jgi:hypothetical protein
MHFVIRSVPMSSWRSLCLMTSEHNAPRVGHGEKDSAFMEVSRPATSVERRISRISRKWGHDRASASWRLRATLRHGTGKPICVDSMLINAKQTLEQVRRDEDADAATLAGAGSRLLPWPRPAPSGRLDERPPSESKSRTSMRRPTANHLCRMLPRRLKRSIIITQL